MQSARTFLRGYFTPLFTLQYEMIVYYNGSCFVFIHSLCKLSRQARSWFWRCDNCEVFISFRIQIIINHNVLRFVGIEKETCYARQTIRVLPVPFLFVNKAIFINSMS
uniref:Uncharacterized protein n=1 Tax=Cacopsylla melanoneura TaxID=428564 RepID=A0A8D8X2F6_9HEMI